DVDAAILEDLHGGGRQRVGDEDFGGHDRQAAFGSASLPLAKAQSSHSVSASTSARSAVEPHQIRNAGGASPYASQSAAAASFASAAERPVPKAACASGGSFVTRGSPACRHTDVSERIAGSSATKWINGVGGTQSTMTLRWAPARACKALGPPIDFPQASVSR